MRLLDICGLCWFEIMGHVEFVEDFGLVLFDNKLILAFGFVFDNRSPSLRPPVGDWALPDMVGPDTDLGTAAGKCSQGKEGISG